MKYLLKASLASALSCELGFLAIGLVQPAAANADQDGHGKGKEHVEHVLLLSVDGLHQSDLAWFAQTHPQSTLASLASAGLDYINASTPFPSDSFPGMVGQVTGGNPATTGIYYDDTWNHDIFPAGTVNCSGPAPGGEVTYFEALDLNLGALDAGQGIGPAPGPDPWANILQMTNNPLAVINPAQLPVYPSTCLHRSQEQNCRARRSPCGRPKRSHSADLAGGSHRDCGYETGRNNPDRPHHLKVAGA